VVAGMNRAWPLLWLVVATAAIALLLLGLAQVIGAGEAAGHATFHALSALPLLTIAGLLLGRWPEAGLAVRGPASGLGAMAIALLVESIGAYGFEADNETRNGLAVVHDLGLTLTAIGLPAAIIGVGLGLGALSMRGHGFARGAGVVGTVTFVAVGLLFVKTMTGF